MKVLFLNTDLGYGGAEKMLAFTANALANQGMDVTFLTYRDNNRCQELVDSVKRVHIQLEQKGGKFFSSLGTIKAICKYIKKGKFDLAIAFLTPSQLRLSIACMFTKTKLLFSQRGDPYNKGKTFKSRLMSKINYCFFNRADLFVFQTEKAKEYYPKRVQSKSCVIPNPIEPLTRTIERSLSSIDKRIVSVARLELKQKRQDLLIEAFKKISEDYPEYVLEFYGSGPDEQRIRQLIGDNNNIRLCGVTREVAKTIQSASMFVLTSDYEGIPNALMEAMSIGVPCISTDCSPGGAAMLIKNKENGLLVKRNDAMLLAEAIKYYIDNPSIAEDFGKKGMLINDEYKKDVIAQKWCSFILSNNN